MSTATATRPVDAFSQQGPAPVNAGDDWIIQHNNLATGKPWTLTHAPTGWDAEFNTRVDLQTWLMKPTDERMREVRITSRKAQGSPRTDDATRRRAYLVLHVLSGVMLAHGTDEDPETVCACGGYLVRPGGADHVHVNTCRYCVDEAVCPDGYREHALCLSPRPAQCADGLCPWEAGLSGYCTTHEG